MSGIDYGTIMSGIDYGTITQGLAQLPFLGNMTTLCMKNKNPLVGVDVAQLVPISHCSKLTCLDLLRPVPQRHRG